MHALALIYIEELFSVAIGIRLVLLTITQCYVFHHHVDFVVQRRLPIAMKRVVVQLT